MTHYYAAAKKQTEDSAISGSLNGILARAE